MRRTFSQVGAFAVFLAASLVCCSWAWSAPVVVDTFSTVNPWNVYQTFTAPGTVQSNVSGAGILGQRDVTIGAPGLVNGGDFLGIGTADFGSLTGQGVLDLNLNANTNSAITLNYDNFGVMNFSGDLGIGLDILAYNNGSVQTQNQIILTTTTGLLTASAITFPNVPPGSMIFLIPFASFTGPGSLSSVTGIQFIFNSNNSSGFDITLDGIQVLATPEPSSLLAWVSVLAAGWFARRRFQKAKA